MSNFIQTTVKDVTENFDNIRVPLSAKQRKDIAKIYPYYGAQSIIDYVDDFLFNGEYLLVAEDGANLMSQNSNVCNIVSGKFWVNNHAHIIRGKDGNSTKYLYYYLNLINYSPFVTGSAQPKLTKDSLNSIPILIHDKTTQKKIAKVLSDLDAKIELNNKINAELESIAKLIYNYWFVQFDFPDENGKPYKSSGGKMVYNEELKREIPDGWEFCLLGDVINKTGTGLNPRKNFKLGEGDNYYVTIKNIDQGKVILNEKCDRINDEALRIINNRSDLRKGDILYTSIQPVGTTYLIREEPKNWNINESVFTIRPDYEKVTSEFLYLFVSGEYIKKYTNYVSAGSIHKGVRHSTLKECKFVLPSKGIVDDFTKLIRPMLEKDDNIQKENQKLAKLRDWLLPMLMNGQVKVK